MNEVKPNLLIIGIHGIMSNWIYVELLLEKDKSKRALMVHCSMGVWILIQNSLGEEGV
jgi:hypothetical protein